MTNELGFRRKHIAQWLNHAKEDRLAYQHIAWDDKAKRLHKASHRASLDVARAYRGIITEGLPE